MLQTLKKPIFITEQPVEIPLQDVGNGQQEAEVQLEDQNMYSKSLSQN